MRRTPLSIVLALAAAAVVGRPALAQSSPKAGATPVQGTRAFEAFHGRPGVERIVHDLRTIYTTDPRISDIFKAADFDRLEPMLINQLCYVLGGGCVYDGKTMAEAHKDMGLQETDFNALVEDLQKAMDHEGVPFSAQNVLLAKLAPMERVVVVR